MICKQCKAEIEDGCLICPHCHASAAFLQQKEVVEKVKDTARVSIEQVFKSNVFLIFAIGLSCVLVTHFGSMMPTLLDIGKGWVNILSLLICIGFIVPPLIATIKAWKLFLHKKGNFMANDIQGLKKLPSFWQTVFSILKFIVVAVEVLVGVVLGIIVVQLLNEKNTIDKVGESAAEEGAGILEGLTSFASGKIAGTILLIICIFIAVVLFFHFFFKICISVYKEINGYLDKMTDSYVNGNFQEGTALPSVKIYVLTAMFLVLSGSLFTGGALNVDVLFGFGGMMLANGVYLALCPVFFKHVEEVQKKNYLLYKKENEKMVELNRQTMEKKNDISRKERREQYEQERQRAQAEQKSKELTQEMLMQQMLMMIQTQQNLQNMVSAKTEIAPTKQEPQNEGEE